MLPLVSTSKYKNSCEFTSMCQVGNKWLLIILLNGVCKYVVIFTKYIFSLCIALVNNWQNTQTGKTQEKLLQVVHKALWYLVLLTGQELLALRWVRLLWTEEVGSLTMEELMRKITVASSLGVFYC